MKKIADSLDDLARIKVAAAASERARLPRLERELRTRVPAGFCAADRLTRDEVHKRDA